MQEFRIAILVIFVSGGLSLPIDNEERVSSNNTKLSEGDWKFQPELRLGLTDRSKYWPGARVYYTIDPSYPQSEQNDIRDAISEIEKYTCVRFSPRTTESDYVEVLNGHKKGCWSVYGMQGGPQNMYLESGRCFDKGKGRAIHEFLHALGLLHTHTAHNRDQYVIVFEDNIKDDRKSNFEKVPHSEASDFGFGYDYGSIMHYAKNTFAIDWSKPTLVAINDPNMNIGQRDGLSEGDILIINHMYC